MAPPPWQKQTLSPVAAPSLPAGDPHAPQPPVYIYPCGQYFVVPPGTQFAGQPIILAPIPNIQSWRPHDVLPQPLILQPVPVPTEQRSLQPPGHNPLQFCPTDFYNNSYMGNPNMQNVNTVQSIYQRSLMPNAVASISTNTRQGVAQNVDTRRNMHLMPHVDARVFEDLANSSHNMTIHRNNLGNPPAVSNIPTRILTNMDTRPNMDIQYVLNKDIANMAPKLDNLSHMFKMNPENANKIAPVPPKPRVASKRHATSSVIPTNMQPHLAHIPQSTIRLPNTILECPEYRVPFQNVPPLVRMQEHPDLWSRMNLNSGTNLHSLGNTVIDIGKTNQNETQVNENKVDPSKEGPKTTNALNMLCTVINEIDQVSENKCQPEHANNVGHPMQYQNADGTRFYILPKQVTESPILSEHTYGTMSVIPLMTENILTNTKPNCMEDVTPQKELLRTILTEAHASTNDYENNKSSLKEVCVPKYIDCPETQPNIDKKNNLTVTNNTTNTTTAVLNVDECTPAKKPCLDINKNSNDSECKTSLNEDSTAFSTKMDIDSVEDNKVVSETVGAAQNIKYENGLKTCIETKVEDTADAVEVSSDQISPLNCLTGKSKCHDVTRIGTDASKKTTVEHNCHEHVLHDASTKATSDKSNCYVVLHDVIRIATDARKATTDKSSCHDFLHDVTRNATTDKSNCHAVLHDVTRIATDARNPATDKSNNCHDVTRIATDARNPTTDKSNNCHDVTRMATDARNPTTDKSNNCNDVTRMATDARNPTTDKSYSSHDVTRIATDAKNPTTDKSNNCHDVTRIATDAKNPTTDKSNNCHDVTRIATDAKNPTTDKSNNCHDVTRIATDARNPTTEKSNNCNDVTTMATDARNPTTAKSNNCHDVAMATDARKVTDESNCQEVLHGVTRIAIDARNATTRTTNNCQDVIRMATDGKVTTDNSNCQEVLNDVTKAISNRCLEKKYNILTHVIDGLVIQEADFPFPTRLPLKEVTQKKTRKRKNKSSETIEKIFRKGKKFYEIGKNVNIIEGKRENAKMKLDVKTLNSWSCADLQEYLGDWCSCQELLLQHEVDGLALTLASLQDLQHIGLHPAHAHTLHHFAQQHK